MVVRVPSANTGMEPELNPDFPTPKRSRDMYYVLAYTTYHAYVCFRAHPAMQTDKHADRQTAGEKYEYYYRRDFWNLDWHLYVLIYTHVSIK